jgi:ATP-binding protein involved in chromosome partitioning
MSLTRETALNALRTVNDPELHKDLVTLNMVKDIRIDGTAIDVTVELTTPACPMKDIIVRDVTAALRGAGAVDVKVNLTAQTRGPQQTNQQTSPQKNLPQVKNVIAVGAGKGGVGKSTVAVNLAVGLQRAGATVGLMDGDIYGPSFPTMLGIKGSVPKVNANKILPFHVHGIHAVTIGALVEPDKPLIWRGPMAHGAFKQLLLDNTDWPALDYLIVDLPPGTGDVSLTLCQLLQLTGAVVVATPQQVALDDAIRAVRMFQQLGAPILGMIENMSGDVFGRGGTEEAAAANGLPFLGRIDLHPELRINADAGRPHSNYETNPHLKASLEHIVGRLAGEISKRNMMSLPVIEGF